MVEGLRHEVSHLRHTCRVCQLASVQLGLTLLPPVGHRVVLNEVFTDAIGFLLGELLRRRFPLTALDVVPRAHGRLTGLIGPARDILLTGIITGPRPRVVARWGRQA